MRKNSEKAPVKEQISQEELELDQILKEIEEDPSLRDAHVPDSVGEKLFAQIAELEVAIQDVPEEEIKEDSMSILEERYPNMANMSEEEKNIFLAGLEATNVVTFKTHRKRSKKKKVYFMVAAIVILTLAMGTVGMGERFKWLQIGEKELEGSDVVAVNSEDERVKVTEDEEIAAYELAKETLGVPVVELKTMEGMEFQQIQIVEDHGRAELLYECNGNVLYYGIVVNQNKVSGFNLPTDELLEEKVIQNGEVEICIRRYKDEEEREIIRANFAYYNIQYSLFGMIEMEAMEEILKKLIFFEN